MGDRGASNYAYSGETTEWEDILIKKGIVEKDDVLRGKGIDVDQLKIDEAVDKARAEAQERLANVTIDDKLAAASLEELDELEDEGLDDDAALQRYRAARLAEMRAARARERFGEVIEISKADWLAEVTEASKEAGLWVVAHLYEDSVVECSVMAAALRVLAAKFKDVKFVRIRSRQAVENWPEKNLPALFCYKEGALAAQLVRIEGLGGLKMRPDALEWWLSRRGIVNTELEEDPMLDGRGANDIALRRGKGAAAARGRGEGEEGDSDGDDYDSDA